MNKYTKRPPKRKGRAEMDFAPLTGHGLRAWREERRWSRETLAKKLGVSLSTLVRIEGVGDEPVDPVYRLAIGAIADGITDYGTAADGGAAWFVTVKTPSEESEEDDDER